MDSFLKLIQQADSVKLDQLEPMTTLVVRTLNSLYRLIVADGDNVLVQGGSFFPEPTFAKLDGASAGGSLLKTGWIGVGLLMEFRAGGKRIVTSPVLAIEAERSAMSIAN